jgi:FtsH-binding integral membrane protein
MSKDKKQVQPASGNSLFTKDNYIWMAAGLLVMALGFILMSGGKSPDPKAFSDSDVYSTTRITIAPILIIAGLVIEIFAIMKKPKES